MQPTGHPRATRVEVLALLTPLVVSAASYARTLRGDFQLDDIEILESGAVKSFATWLGGAFLPEKLVAGRPLTTLTFAANYAAGRLDPFGYHTVNLAIHLCVVLLVGLLTLRVAELAGAERPRRIALGVAGLFAVHPLHGEAVSYVSQRAEILASALYAATLLLLLAPEPRGTRRPRGYSAAALVTFALGLAAKPVVVTLPAAFVAIRLAAAPRAVAEGEEWWRGILLPVAPITAAAGVFAVALLVTLRGRPDAGFSAAGTSPWLYFLTQLRASVVYLRLLVWPAGQSVDWQFPTSPGLADPATLGAALAILTVATAAVLLFVRGQRHATHGGAAARLAGLGIAWYFILLSPTSSFVPLADNLVEHRVYLPSWGIFLTAVVALDALAARLGARRSAAVAWLAAVLVLAVGLHRRNAVWQSKEALWSDALAKTPRSARARVNLGEAYDAQGRTEDAIRQYELALAYTGGNVAQRAKVLLSLGAAQMVAGRTEEARRSFAAGLHFLPNDDRLLANMAVAAGASGDAQAADSFARRALAVNPAQATSWVVFGNLRLEREDWPGALSTYDRAIAIDPERGEAHYGRALALRMLSRADEECAALRAALQARLIPEYRTSIQSQVATRCR